MGSSTITDGASRAASEYPVLESPWYCPCVGAGPDAVRAVFAARDEPGPDGRRATVERRGKRGDDDELPPRRHPGKRGEHRSRQHQESDQQLARSDAVTEMAERNARKQSEEAGNREAQAHLGCPQADDAGEVQDADDHEHAVADDVDEGRQRHRPGLGRRRKQLHTPRITHQELSANAASQSARPELLLGILVRGLGG